MNEMPGPCLYQSGTIIGHSAPGRGKGIGGLQNPNGFPIVGQFSVNAIPLLYPNTRTHTHRYDQLLTHHRCASHYEVLKGYPC